MKPWLYIAAAAAVAWWLLRKQEPPKEAPVQIGTLRTETGDGPTAEESANLFDQLFGLRDAQSEFAKLKGTSVSLRSPSCHSDGSCLTYDRYTNERYPLIGPEYFINYLGIMRF